MIDPEKISKAFDAVKGTYVPKILKVEKFIIVASEVGSVGTYRVIEETPVE